MGSINLLIAVSVCLRVSRKRQPTSIPISNLASEISSHVLAERTSIVMLSRIWVSMGLGDGIGPNNPAVSVGV